MPLFPERFTTYRQQGQSTVNSIRQKMQQQRQASLKNRRLAQQMANRPSVIAALKIKRRSLNLKQRLGQTPGGFSTGSNIKSRLAFGRQGNRSVRGRLGGGQSGRTNRGRGGMVAVQKGIRWSSVGESSNSMRSGTSPMLKARLGIQNPTNRSGQRNRGGYKRGRGRNNRQQRGSNFRGQQQFRNNRNAGGTSGSGRRRGGQGGRNRGQNRNRGGRSNWGKGIGGNKRNVPTKQELDNQLDEYMAKTKSHLDAELDAYMSQADS